jgi:hypothetical protein
MWWECRVSSADEDWVGRGNDTDEAFARALAQLFPSRAALLALHDLLPAPSVRDASASSAATPAPANALDAPTRQYPAVVARAELRIEQTSAYRGAPRFRAAKATHGGLTILEDVDSTRRERDRQPAPEASSFAQVLGSARIATCRRVCSNCICSAGPGAPLQHSAPPSPAVEFAAGGV